MPAPQARKEKGYWARHGRLACQTVSGEGAMPGPGRRQAGLASWGGQAAGRRTGQAGRRAGGRKNHQPGGQPACCHAQKTAQGRKGRRRADSRLLSVSLGGQATHSLNLSLPKEDCLALPLLLSQTFPATPCETPAMPWTGGADGQTGPPIQNVCVCVCLGQWCGYFEPLYCILKVVVCLLDPNLSSRRNGMGGLGWLPAIHCSHPGFEKPCPACPCAYLTPLPCA